MVDGVGDLSTILGELLIRLDGGAGGDFSEEPVGEWGLLCDFSGGFETRDDGRGVVAFGVGKVAEVEGGLDRGIRRGEVDTTAGSGTGDVGRHAECV